MNLRTAIFSAIWAIFLTFPAFAETQTGTRYRATIWVDPDGCQHWVIDTGLEGFMSQRLTRSGQPVCNQPLTIACADPAKSSVVVDGAASCQ